MKKHSSRLFVFVLPLFMAVVACTCGLPTSLKDIPIPSLQTRIAPTVAATTDYKFNTGLTIASEKTLDDLIANKTDIPIVEQLAKEKYTESELSQAGKTYTFTVALDKEQPLALLNGWCTTSAKILEDNFKNIKIEFTANGASIDPNYILVTEREDPTNKLFCRSFFIILYNWPKGKTELQVAVTFAQKINDGMSDYPKGTHYYKYTITR